MLTKEQIINEIERYHNQFEGLNPEVAKLSAEQIFKDYFYEESEEISDVAFNPQTGENLRVGNKIYYNPDKANLVPEEFRNFVEKHNAPTSGHA